MEPEGSTGPLAAAVAKLVEDARGYLEEGIPTRLHLHDPIVNDPRPFTRKFATYLDKPPMWLVFHRRRKYGDAHYRRGHNPCHCSTRLGYRLVRAIVLDRRPLNEVIEQYALRREAALVVLADELRTLENLVLAIKRK